MRDIIKILLQKGITPFLSSAKLQKRFVIIHEILSSQRAWFQHFLALIDYLPATEVTLTFDDGFYSSYQAIKQLKNRKAIFFVCPDFINLTGTLKWQDFFHNNLLRKEALSNKELREAVRPVTWDELKELVSLGHTIGSHSMNHKRLSSNISTKELEKEIIGSADMIEDRLGVKVDTIAYPFGNIKSIDKRALKIIEKRYTQCFSGLRGNNYSMENQLVRWRDVVHFHWPVDYIAFLLRGGFDWYYGIKRMRLRNIIG